MAGDFTATLSSVFGFFVTAAGCEKDGASRLSVKKKKKRTPQHNRKRQTEQRKHR